MASGYIFDPVTALRVVPLVSATCTLAFAHDQHLLLGAFAAPEHRQLARVLLPAYFRRFLARRIWPVAAALGLTFAASLANLGAAPAPLRQRGTGIWYAAAAALSVSHLLFAPALAPRAEAIAQADTPDGREAGADPNTLLRSWLNISLVRTLTVDLGAWLAAGVAVLKTVQG